MDSRIVLKTGDRFTSVANGKTFNYEFVGFDFSDVENGTGCRYIVLKDLSDNTFNCVEAAWFLSCFGRKVMVDENE